MHNLWIKSEMNNYSIFILGDDIDTKPQILTNFALLLSFVKKLTSEMNVNKYGQWECFEFLIIYIFTQAHIFMMCSKWKQK